MGCSCGYSAGEGAGELHLSGHASHTHDVHVVQDDGPSLPIVDAKCKKCGNEKSYHWEQQTRAADEPATRFYRCTACKHTWREYK